MTIKNGAAALVGSACLNSVELAFRDAMQNFFGPLNFMPTADGKRHYFHIADDGPGTRNGWYVLYVDGTESGNYGNRETGVSYTWKSHDFADPYKALDAAHRTFKVTRQLKIEQCQQHQAAAAEAEHLWATGLPADPKHPYLIANGCSPFGLRQHGEALLVPLYQDRKLANLQRIYPDGRKHFIQEGRIQGCYSPIGRRSQSKSIYICKSWATGAMIHAATGAAVACAMNPDNLLEVWHQLQLLYPNNPLICAESHNRRTDRNPARTARNNVAIAMGCSLILAPLPDDTLPELSDLNDLADWRATQ